MKPFLSHFTGLAVGLAATIVATAASAGDISGAGRAVSAGVLVTGRVCRRQRNARWLKGFRSADSVVGRV